jgi:hypothetical protein
MLGARGWLPRTDLGTVPADVVSGGVATRDRCRRATRVARHAPDPAKAPIESGLTLLEAGDRWLSTYVATTRNRKGQKLAKSRLDGYLVPGLGSVRLRELNGDDVRLYRQYLERYYGLRPHTVTHVLSDLRCLLRWAVSMGLLERSPFRLRRVPLGPELLQEISRCEWRLVPYAAGSPGSFSRGVRHRTGIVDFHVHRCRHTFAMRWLEAGGNLAVLQQILGHRDLSTTMRYARVTDELIEREAERVGRQQRVVR